MNKRRVLPYTTQTSSFYSRALPIIIFIVEDAKRLIDSFVATRSAHRHFSLWPKHPRRLDRDPPNGNPTVPEDLPRLPAMVCPGEIVDGPEGQITQLSFL